MAYDVGVRSYLTGKGVPGTDIGFDKNSGNVTVKGQNFYKPELNMSNTTYSNQTNLDNAYNTYSKSLQPSPTAGNAMPGAAVGAMAGIPKTGIPQTETVAAPKTMMSSTSTTTPSKKPAYTNPYVTQYEDIMKRLDESNKAMQQPVDIYSTPEYAAVKANQDKAAKQSTRVAQESMGASGFGRSTNLQDRAQGIQNEANDYLQTQLVPQIQNALTNKNQQQYNNLLQQFNTIYQMVNQADSQHQNEINNENADRTFDYNAAQDAITNNRNAANDYTAATGIYNPSGMSYEEVKAQMDKNSAAYGAATPEEQARLHDENIQLGSQIGQTYNSQKGTYSKDQGYVGIKTLTSQQIEQELATGKMTQEAAEYNLKELKDPKSATNQAKALDLQMKKLDATNYPEEVRIRLQTAQKTLNQIGVVHYKPQTDAEKQLDLLQVDKIKADIEKVKSDTNVKNAKGALVNVKDSSDAYDTVYQDIAETLDLQEALNLVEQNAPYLTDSDYRAAKEDARKKYEVKKDAKDNKYGP